MLITLDEGLKLVRWFEIQIAPHAHCALCGSVLHKGGSAKDIDIIVYPHNERFAMPKEKIVELIQSVFPDARDIANSDYPTDRLILRSHATGRTIEFFILS